MKRHYLAIGTSLVLLAFGGSTALANGSHAAAPANTASQSASSVQLLPISLGAGAALPVNANLPLGLLSSGPAQGAVTQQAAADARGRASNNAVSQSVRQSGGDDAGQRAAGAEPLADTPPVVAARPRAVSQDARAQSSGAATNSGTVQAVRQEGGGNSASQSATSTQLLPIALGLGAAAPVNANVPVGGLLSAGPGQGEVRQRAEARASGDARNNQVGQSIEQRGDRTGSGGNAASQSATSTQLLPIALGLGAAAPVNANVPVGLLSAGPVQGEVRQRADADAAAQARNNETRQAVRQQGAEGARNAASQSATSTQLLPIALGAALGVPVNANVPVAILSAGPRQGEVDQHADARARARAANNEHDQSVRQRAGRDGQNAASQSASNTQLLPVALGAALGIPINANVPVAILSAGPVQGEVRQRADADAAAQALNNEAEQAVRQEGGEGGRNTASQSAGNTQLLPVALGAALALPINLNLPIAILSSGPIQGEVSQQGVASATAEALNNEVDQSVEQRSGRNAASQSGSNTQVLPVALGPAVALPLNLNLPVSVLSNGQVLGVAGLDVVNLLANPFGLLGNPTGAVTGLLGAL